MKWISINEDVPTEYEWVLVGFVDDFDNMCYRIARLHGCKNDYNWTFFDELGGGPYAGDSVCPLLEKNITHWFRVPDLSEQEKIAENDNKVLEA